MLEALDRLGGRTHTLHTGVFAGREEGAHWVHGGIDNVPVSTLLDMHKVGQVRVGGDDDYEGSRSRLLMLSSSNVPLTAAERDVSFDLFESARAASEAFASEAWQKTQPGQPASSCDLKSFFCLQVREAKEKATWALHEGCMCPAGST